MEALIILISQFFIQDQLLKNEVVIKNDKNLYTGSLNVEWKDIESVLLEGKSLGKLR